MRIFYLFIIGLLFFAKGFSQTQTIEFKNSGSYQWTVPCGVTSITVDAWGAGAAGSNNGGGGGGAYASKVFTVTPGTTYSINVGRAGGTYGGGWFSTPNTEGENTVFGNNLVRAEGGGQNGGYNKGGRASACIGDIRYSGGDGGAAGTSSGGSGGGGSAGRSGQGGNGTRANNSIGRDGGEGGLDGGAAGGKGGNSNASGRDGGFPGGGGGERGNAGFFNSTANGDGGSGQLNIVYQSAVNNYCNIAFNNTEPITSVIFAGINNTSSNSKREPSYERFCDIGEVMVGNSHPITLKGFTDGNFTNFFTVFIDWNQDGSFGNGEMYQIGSIINSSGTDNKSVSGNIGVPSNAKLGLTTMRVVKNYSTSPINPCATYSYGQAEDYLINVISPCLPSVIPASALANGLTAATVCEGNEVTLTQSGGTLGLNARWVWRAGSASGVIVGTSIAANAELKIIPTTTTTYYVNAEGGCSPNTLSRNIKVILSPKATISLTTNNDNQIVCINSPITNIVYSTSGITGGNISSGSLPAGVTGKVEGGQFVIKGTPSVFGTFNYTITTTGAASPCSNVSISGKITVSPAPGNLNYSTSLLNYCTGKPIIPLHPVFENGTPTNFSISPALPAGLSIDPSTGIISGTPSAISTSQNYTIVASNSCGSSAKTITIEVIAGAKVFNVTPNGETTYCSINAGVTVGLSGSETGIIYQLFKNGVAIGGSHPGTGAAISFGTQTAGIYTIKATNGSCVVDMNGQATITVTANPTVKFSYPVNTFCSNGFSPKPTFTGTPNNGIFSSTSGLVIDATTGIIDLGASTPGDYKIRYTIPSRGGCIEYFYTQDISIEASPHVFEVYGGGGYCSGSEGVAIGLDNSQVGVNYQLYRGNTAVGSPVAGTGGDIVFSNQTVAGTYTVKAKKAGSSICEVTMEGNAVVSVVSLPASFIITPSASMVCMNNVISLSANTNTVSTSATVTIPSGNIALSIPNNNLSGAFDLLRVTGIPEGATITRVSVKLNVNHPRVEDLIINLKGPNGNSLNLFNNLAASGRNPSRNNFTNTTFASDATNTIVGANPPYSGTYKPQNSMGAIGADVVSNNKANVGTFAELFGLTSFTANGDWIISILDNKSSNSGSLNNWEIKIEYTVSANPINVSWSPATNLYMDAAATIPYSPYSTASIVYAKPTAAGTFKYTATATNATGCSVSKDQTINITQAPTLIVAANYCDYPGKIRITATSDMNISGWLWTGDVTAISATRNSYIEPNSAGTFNVSATAANGCQVTGAMSVAQELVYNGDFSLGNVGFSSGYNYVSTPFINGQNNSGLRPEKTYNIYHDAQYTHNNFWGRDHTKGSGLAPDNFMIVNGYGNTVVWEQTVTVLPNTDYYFSAYAMNLNDDGNYAKLRFEVNGVPVGTIADLSTAPKPSNASTVSPNNWIRFYSDPVWKSHGNTTAIIRIINLQPALGGNDFGLDDISFGTLSTFLNLTSAPGTNNQVGICGDKDIVDISYEIGGDGQHPVLSNLPQGLSTSWNGRDLRIFGTADAFGDFNYQVTSTGCNPKTALGKIYVDEPTKAGNFNAPIISTCYNSSVNLALSNSLGTVSGWKRSTNDGATWMNISGTGTTLNLANVTSAALYKASVKNKSCDALETPVVKVGVRNLWTGEQSTDWMAKKNWSDESLPTTTLCDNVIIPVVSSGKYPVLNTGMTSVKNLQINNNAKVTLLDGVLQVAGTIINNGTLDATKGSIEFNGTSSQTLSGSILKDKTIKNLIVSNTAELRISSNLNDTLNISGTLSFGKSTAKLNTGDNITLKSTAQGTANVGVVNDNNIITGKFVVERFINAGTTQNPGAHQKSWQLLATPTTGASIKDSWQEGAVSNGKLPMQNPSVGFGTLLTTGYNKVPLNGFDFYTNAGPSIKTFNSATNNYDKGPESTLDPIYNPKGYMVLVRGDRTIYTSNADATPTVLRSKGRIITGTTTPITVKKDTWESIGNPYPSQLDLRKLTTTGGVDKTIFVWDPKLGGSYGLGAFQTLTITNGDYFATPGGGSYGSGANNYIQSGQAFMVQATGSDGTLRFTEAMKEPGSQSVLRGGTGDKNKVGQIRTNLYGVANGIPFLTDGNLVQFSKDFNSGIDGNDARKMANTSENFAIRTGGMNLVIERRKDITVADTIFFHLTGVRVQAYQFKIEASNIKTPGLEAWLEDSYLKTKTPVNLEGITTIDFTIANSAGSYASDRFRIIFKPAAPAAPLPVTFVYIKASQINKDVLVEWHVEMEMNLKHYEIEKSLDGITFIKASVELISGNHNGKYQWLDQKPNAGYNYYRIKSVDLDGKTSFSSIAKVKVEKAIGTISVYPNPITNGIVNLQLHNQVEGVYGIRLLNPVGQVLLSKKIEHGGGNYTEKINWDYKMAKGMYQIEVTKPGGDVHLIKLVY